MRWLVAYRTTSWTDLGLGAWVDRVEPYVTDAMHQQNLPLRTATVGTDWIDYVAKRCTSSVSNSAAVIPAEAPNTATTAHVQVTGTIRTTCAQHSSNAPLDEDAFATLILVKTTHGWRVSKRLY